MSVGTIVVTVRKLFARNLRSSLNHQSITTRNLKWIEKTAQCLVNSEIKPEHLIVQSFHGQDELLIQFHKAGISSLWAWKCPRHEEDEAHVIKYNDSKIHLKLSSFASLIPKNDWKSESSVAVYRQVPSSTSMASVVNSWIRDLENRSMIFLLGRVPHFILVSGKEFKLMAEGEEVYSKLKTRTPWICFMYSMMFDCNLISKIPSKKLGLKSSKPVLMEKANLDVDREHFYLVKIIPKSDLFLNVCDAENLNEMMRFCSNLYGNSTQRLIPYMEKLIPDSGPLLIQADYTMNHKVADINFMQFHKFFKLMQTFPNYHQSPFLVKKAE